MRSIIGPAALAAGLAAAGAAWAEGASVYDLGEMPTRDACMRHADKVLNSYLDSNGGSSVEITEWVAYGWDFQPGDNDVVLMCPIFRGDVVNALLVIYGEDTDQSRIDAADEIERLWGN